MNEEFMKRLHEERMRAWEQVKALLERAAEEKRDLTGEEEEQYRRLNERVDSLGQRIDDLMEQQRSIKRVEDAFEELRSKPVVDDAAEKRAGNAVEELRAWMRGDRGGRVFDLVPESRDLSKGTATAGGNTVPTSFYRQLQEHMIEVSGVLAARPWVMRTATGENIQVPKTTAHSSSAGIVAEGGALSESDPTFGLVTVGAYKYGFLIQVTHELLNDTGVDLLGYLARQAGRALGNGLGAHLVTGTGTGQPQGVATAATAGKTGAGPTPTAEDLIDLYHSVISPYRNSASCAWLMNDATVAAIRKLRDDSGASAGTGQFLWQPGLQAGDPDTILGKPVYVDPFVADAEEGEKSVLFGDFSTYLVRQVETIRIERSEDYAFNTDLVTFRFIIRGDGRQIDTTGSIKAFVGGAGGGA